MFPLQIILHPTDFSPAAATAYKLACSLARDTGAKLLVLHVAPAPIVVYGTGVVPPDPVAERNQVREMLTQQHPADPRLTQEFLVISGDPVPGILKEAGDRKANLIVMGTHGRTGVSRLLMGSVAEQVLRHAECPVLVARVPG